MPDLYYTRLVFAQQILLLTYLMVKEALFAKAIHDLCKNVHR